MIATSYIPNQTKPNQTKPKPTKPNQAQIKLVQIKASAYNTKGIPKDCCHSRFDCQCQAVLCRQAVRRETHLHTLQLGFFVCQLGLQLVHTGLQAHATHFFCLLQASSELSAARTLIIMLLMVASTSQLKDPVKPFRTDSLLPSP